MCEATCGIISLIATISLKAQHIIVLHMLDFSVPCTGKAIELIRLDEEDVNSVFHYPPEKARQDAALESGPLFSPRKTPLKLPEEPRTSGLADGHCCSIISCRQQSRYLLRNHRAALGVKISNTRTKSIRPCLMAFNFYFV